MQTVLISIAFIIALLLAAILLYAVTRPDTFRVERTTSIKAPPEAIFGYINDFHRWGAWSPYERMDPQMKRTFGGAASGVGATYAWEGDKTGSGRMEIMEAAAPSKVGIKLDFSKPFKANNTAEFTMRPNGASTDVTWAMYGPSLFVGKVMGLVFNMDKMVGSQFEEGLANLKAVAEK